MSLHPVYSFPKLQQNREMHVNVPVRRLWWFTAGGVSGAYIAQNYHVRTDLVSIYAAVCLCCALPRSSLLIRVLVTLPSTLEQIPNIHASLMRIVERIREWENDRRKTGS